MLGNSAQAYASAEQQDVLPLPAVDSQPTSEQAANDAAALLPPALYLVATPIGNLEDITFRYVGPDLRCDVIFGTCQPVRWHSSVQSASDVDYIAMSRAQGQPRTLTCGDCRAVRVLKQCDTIFAEDCRHTHKLTSRYDISTPLISYHAHNEAKRQSTLLQLLDRGLPVALVSDAGTPGVSDPGASAVAAAVSAGHRVVPIPGPSAVVTALAASGMPTDAFLFVGFMAPRSGARKKELEMLRSRITVRSHFTRVDAARKHAQQVVHQYSVCIRLRIRGACQRPAV